MKTVKESKMKKLIASLIIAGSAVAIPAQAQHHGHGGYYRSGGGWVAPLIGGVIIGGVLSQPRYVYPAPPPVYVYPQPQVVYGAPTTVPVIPAPGQVCELRSEMINGQVVTGNFCYAK
jgi:hypothetical protein